MKLLLDPSLGYRTLDAPPQLPENEGMQEVPQRDASAERLSVELENLEREMPVSDEESSAVVNLVGCFILAATQCLLLL